MNNYKAYLVAKLKIDGSPYPQVVSVNIFSEPHYTLTTIREDELYVGIFDCEGNFFADARQRVMKTLFTYKKFSWLTAVFQSRNMAALSDVRSLLADIEDDLKRKDNIKMPRTNYIQLRLSDSEIASYKSLADKADLSCASWMRETLNNAVRADNVKIAFNHRYAEAKERAELLSQKLTQRRAESAKHPYRELSSSELSCPVRGCSLGSSHSGPCIPSVGDPETKEIYIQNLIVLSRDDPEEFRNKIRELLSADAARNR